MSEKGSSYSKKSTGSKKKKFYSKSPEELEKEIKELSGKAMKNIESYTDDPEEVKKLADFMGQFHYYSKKNMALINEQFNGAKAVGSFDQFKKAGFSVSKGEKAIKIFVPTPVQLFKTKDGIKNINQATPSEREQIVNGLIKVNKIMKYKLGNVFDVSQTNATAEDLPKIFPNRKYDFKLDNDISINQLNKGLEKISEGLNVPIREMADSQNGVTELGVAKGAYVQGPGGEEILLNPRLPGTDKTTTLIHELAHAKAHKNSTLSPGEKEFQAELTSYVVSKHYGIDTSEQTVPYIAKWTKNGENVEDKVKLLEEVHTISREFIKVIDETIEAEQTLEAESLQVAEVEKKDNEEKQPDKIELQNNQNDIIEKEKNEMQDRYFKVEFNETNLETGIISYEGRIVTPELIQVIKVLDDQAIPEQGYYKFYFDEVVNGEVVSNFRMDVGDGVNANQKKYDYLLEGTQSEKEQTKPTKLSEGTEEDKVTIENKKEIEASNESKMEKQAVETKKQSFKKYVSKEEVLAAKQVDIVDYATSNGISLIKDSERYYRWADHDSLVIDRKENFFNWNSQGIDGDSVQFAQTVGGIGSLPEAVQILNGGEYEAHSTESVPQEPYYYDSTREVIDFSKARDYLVNERKADPKIVDVLHKNGLLAQDKYNNVVFKAVEDGEVVGASEQGTVRNENYKRGSWKHIQENSKKGTGFHFTVGKPENIKFFESGTDALSYASINKAEIQNTRFVSMDGLKPDTVLNHTERAVAELGKVPNSVSLCVDNDPAGTNFSERKSFVEKFNMLQLQREDGTMVQFEKEMPEIPLQKQAEGIEKWDWTDERGYQVEQLQSKQKQLVQARATQSSGIEM
ncbi:DUF3991 domain-containing protein [Carnobacterium maltaromaticum]|uniref:DUF3991 domain-containing protein n=1 Tax=Carnobacterium maltaromaticum TaxID=2751 RepID=UPI00069230CF|nr:DUF3991 domain-containing protein [Carnobacterium maltaromaticum]KRN68093.1 hypothetical protein IV70_GL001735 [Carnobacterium maltaromaticum DSM 20342]